MITAPAEIPEIDASVSKSSVIITREKGKILPLLAAKLLRTRVEVADVISVEKGPDGNVTVQAVMKEKVSLADVVRSMGFAVLEAV